MVDTNHGKYIYEILEYGRNIIDGYANTTVLYKIIEEDMVFVFLSHAILNCDKWKDRYFGSDSLHIENLTDGGW